MIMEKKYLAIDVGGSSIKYALLNQDAKIIEKSSVKTPTICLDDFVETIGRIYDLYMEDIEGIAMSMPGIIDPARGFCYTGGALQYIHNLDMVEILQQRCSCKITIGNDAKCAANAEVGFGTLKDVEDAICVILGTGVGGCLIKDRQVHIGKHFSAGEFSFIQTHIENGFDPRYVWANISGITGLLNCVKKHYPVHQKLTGIDIFEMANNGNESVLKGIDEFSRNIAIELYNLHMIFDSQKIAIGGGISNQPLLIDLINKNFQMIFDSIPFDVPRTEIVACQYHNDSNLIGALYQFLVSKK
ncbi:ROK family protein [Faecalibacillus intestinalis]|uniref:ROK family protein n=1 Tax=Faecalibacillus intestinalis TaxID=1982626 RepID=UPI00351FF35A